GSTAVAGGGDAPATAYPGGAWSAPGLPGVTSPGHPYRRAVGAGEGGAAMIVVDTNVVAYLVIPGGRTAMMEAVWGKDSDWIAPPLIRHELHNVLVKQMLHGGADEAAMMNAFDVAMQRVELANQPSISHILRLAARSRCTSYDCEFVAVTETLNVSIVTTDRAVLAAFPDRA